MQKRTGFGWCGFCAFGDIGLLHRNNHDLETVIWRFTEYKNMNDFLKKIVSLVIELEKTEQSGWNDWGENYKA